MRLNGLLRVSVCAGVSLWSRQVCVGPQAHLANGLFVLGGSRGDLQKRWMLWHRGAPLKLGQKHVLSVCVCVGLNTGRPPPNKLKTALLVTPAIPRRCFFLLATFKIRYSRSGKHLSSGERLLLALSLKECSSPAECLRSSCAVLGRISTIC